MPTILNKVTFVLYVRILEGTRFKMVNVNSAVVVKRTMLFQFCVTYSTICMAADSIYRIYTNNCCTIFHAIPEHCLYIHKLILQERKAISIPQPPYIHVCCIAEHVLRYFTILISGTINCT